MCFDAHQMNQMNVYYGRLPGRKPFGRLDSFDVGFERWACQRPSHKLKAGPFSTSRSLATIASPGQPSRQCGWRRSLSIPASLSAAAAWCWENQTHSLAQWLGRYYAFGFTECSVAAGDLDGIDAAAARAFVITCGSIRTVNGQKRS